MCRSTAVALALVLGAAVAAHAQTLPTTGELSGVIVERGSERPLVGVSVVIAGSDRNAITDEEGRFHLLGAPAGKVTLVLTPPAPHRCASTRRSPPAAIGRCAISSRRRRRRAATSRPCAHRASSAPASSSSASAGRRRAAPPAAADDPLKVVEDLPGVARATVGSGDIIVWGAAPADTRVVFDGVECPRSSTSAAGARPIAAGLVARVGLTPGGFGADWGRALGGLVRVDGAGRPADGVARRRSAPTCSTAGALISYARGRFAITIAGRYSWLDKLAGAVVHGDAAAFIPLPRWDDYQLRASVALRRHERLDAHLPRRRRCVPPRGVERRSDAQSAPTDFDRSSYRAILRYEPSATAAPSR